MTQEQMQLCKFHYRGTCAIHREPTIKKYRDRSGAVIGEVVLDGDACKPEFCPFQRESKLR